MSQGRHCSLWRTETLASDPKQQTHPWERISHELQVIVRQ